MSDEMSMSGQSKPVSTPPRRLNIENQDTAASVMLSPGSGQGTSTILDEALCVSQPEKTAGSSINTLA